MTRQPKHSQDRRLTYQEIQSLLVTYLLPRFSASEYYDKRQGRMVVEFRNVWD